MNHDFPRILTLLRKEQGLSQKQVAADLNVSQALLSHYEKGIRECGLDFVVKVADYYHVSCDYMLGRTPQRDGSRIAVDELPGEMIGKNRRSKNTPAEYQRRILVDSLHIVFAILKKINSKSLLNQVSAYLSGSVYKAFRLLYAANPKNPLALFELDPRLSSAAIDALMSLSSAKCRYVLTGGDIDGGHGVHPEQIPAITPSSLAKEFPQYSPALFDLIRNTEKSAKSQGIY